jgi:hypothetical protein
VTEWNLLRPPAIGCDKSCCHTGTRQNPLEIFGSEARGACPELLLIGDQVLEKRRDQPILGIFPRLKLIAIV